ncbi:PA-phosphatase, partial [Mesorhizobium sp. M6A.T.Ce.TU.002.03.1.1]
MKQLRDLVAKNDAQTAAGITFWDAGSPGYRWIELVNNRLLENQQIPNAHRVYTYMTMAIHDATIAAWESKYFHNRPRPSEADTTLPTALPTPRSPSYPSEHASAA